MDFFFCFFFSSRRRHTRLTCDWSSDVCSSDLCAGSSSAPARANAAAKGSDPLKQRDCLSSESFTPAGEAEPVGGRGAHGDWSTGAPRQLRLHLRAPVGNARLLSDENTVRVDEL